MLRQLKSICLRSHDNDDEGADDHDDDGDGDNDDYDD